jgi:ribonuclease E
VVRTRTDVALYVLNHKRGHLRDLESSFKVTLAVIADPTVSGQQSFIIDRGEQVHTLEAAKALLAAQVAAFPPQIEDADDDEEPFDIEVESEIETEETEGLTDDSAANGESAGEADGHKRKRRRRRRGRSGEAREGGPMPREDHDVARVASEIAAIPGMSVEDGESDEDEADEQPGMVRADQATGDRRPRRRGRRGGRRRRGGLEDGLAGSIADELRPASTPEASNAVADFEGYAPPAPSLPVVQPEASAPPAEQQHVERAESEVARSTETETAQEAERAARRRSTVREKVSFLVTPVEPAPATDRQPAPNSQPEPAPAQPAAETTTETQPRRAGWWSRRFGGGE